MVLTWQVWRCGAGSASRRDSAPRRPIVFRRFGMAARSSPFRSRFGFGCYRIGSEVALHRAALHRALALGCTTFDTSPNYVDGESERLLGQVLIEAQAQHGVARHELFITTKVGAIQGYDLAYARQREAEGRGWSNVVKLSESSWFCLAPDFIEHSVRSSAERLGTWPDAVLLHNPELLLSDLVRHHGTAAATSSDSQSAFYAQLTDAFEACERLTDAHARGETGVRVYGVSTNPFGCRWSVSGDVNVAEATCLKRLFKSAEAAATRHGRSMEPAFRIVQLPLNLLEPHAAMATTLHGHGESSDAASEGPPLSPIDLANQLGLTVMAHRPLNAIPPADLAPASRERKNYLVLRETRPVKPTLALLRHTVGPVLLAAAGRHLSLEELALLFTASAPGVDVTLCGMRSPAYVERTLALNDVLVPPETHRAAVQALRTLLKELDPGAAGTAG